MTTDRLEAKPESADTGEEVDETEAGIIRASRLPFAAFAQGPDGQLRNPPSVLIPVGAAAGDLEEVGCFLYGHTGLLA